MEECTNDGLLDFPEPQSYGIALDVAGASQFAFDDARPGRSPPSCSSVSATVTSSRRASEGDVSIPKTGAEIITKAITAAVEAGALWLVSGPASVLAEVIPTGVLTSKAILRQPPSMIAAAEILGAISLDGRPIG
jgi:hypothetical protein